MLPTCRVPGYVPFQGFQILYLEFAIKQRATSRAHENIHIFLDSVRCIYVCIFTHELRVSTDVHPCKYSFADTFASCVHMNATRHTLCSATPTMLKFCFFLFIRLCLKHIPKDGAQASQYHAPKSARADTHVYLHHACTRADTHPQCIHASTNTSACALTSLLRTHVHTHL